MPVGGWRRDLIRSLPVDNWHESLARRLAAYSEQNCDLRPGSALSPTGIDSLVQLVPGGRGREDQACDAFKVRCVTFGRGDGGKV